MNKTKKYIRQLVQFTSPNSKEKILCTCIFVCSADMNEYKIHDKLVIIIAMNDNNVLV